MAYPSISRKSKIKLPVQTLNWGLIKRKSNLKKIIFQFDVKSDKAGRKVFNLVAYPVSKNGKNWKIHNKVFMPIQKPARYRELPLPLSLGNLEVSCQKLKTWNKLGKANLTVIPRHYKANDHAACELSDGSDGTTLYANPSPPAKPIAG